LDFISEVSCIKLISTGIRILAVICIGFPFSSTNMIKRATLKPTNQSINIQKNLCWNRIRGAYTSTVLPKWQDPKMGEKWKYGNKT